MRSLSPQKPTSFQNQNAVPCALTLGKPAAPNNTQTQVLIQKYKYDQNDQLGKGFTGRVFKAVEVLNPHKRYAVKVVDLKKFRGANLQMLQTEIQIHKALTHQNIVKLHEVIKKAQHYYLVMQYCPHGNLTEYIAQKKQLSESNALQIVTQIVAAYKYLLEQGVIHRDIKPANILRVGNKWKLSDFGFSTRSRVGFKDHMNVGTPLYMAPQSLRKNYYSYKSDFFAIGVVLYEMVVGQAPHEVKTEKQLLQKISEEIVVPKAIKNSKLGDFLGRISVINESKRMTKEEFINFEFVNSTLSICKSSSILFIERKASYEQSSEKFSDFSFKVNPKEFTKKTSDQFSYESSLLTKTKSSEQGTKPISKNPMFTNKQLLNQQLQFIQHFYFSIKNIQSFHLQSNTQNMYVLTIFKLLIKLLRLLCDKSQNYLQLSNWEQFIQCKLYQQLYSGFHLYSQQYQKQFLEFIKYNDIKVIRAVNRKFPQLCKTEKLTSKFYQHFKGFMEGVVKQHQKQVNNLVEQGQQNLNDRYEALQSAYKIYKFAEARSNCAQSTVLGQKPTLLEDYKKSKQTKISFNKLKRLVNIL